MPNEEIREFATLEDALDYMRREWPSVRILTDISDTPYEETPSRFWDMFDKNRPAYLTYRATLALRTNDARVTTGTLIVHMPDERHDEWEIVTHFNKLDAPTEHTLEMLMFSLGSMIDQAESDEGISPIHIQNARYSLSLAKSVLAEKQRA